MMHKKHALIVGASSGLGSECLRHFAKNYNVTGLSRRGTLPNEVIATESLGLACDGTNINELRTSIEVAVERFGKISLVIVSSGIQNIKPVRNFKQQESIEMIQTNLLLPYNVASIFASQKISVPDAVLCFITSIAAQNPEPGIVLYGATKSAVESLVVGLAKELAPKRVVGISPGWLDTPMTRGFSNIYNENYLDGIKKKSALGLVNVSDVVKAIDFMVSEAASKITGQVLTVDGGLSL
jgi:NAD(P)-dependent dehydrogenase (short-subunit alcohol dehydrogenase family)